MEAPGRRRDRDDGSEHDQADRDTGEPGRGLAVDDAEDREHQDERADELGGERLRHAHSVRVVRRHAQADVTGLLAEHADDRRGADDGADDLGADVRRHLAPRELAGDGQSQGDRRVDVVATDVPEGVDGGDDDGAERQGDHAQIGHRERRVAVDDQRGGHRAHPDEHQKRRSDGLSTQALEQIGLVKHARSSSLVYPNDDSILSNVIGTLRLWFTSAQEFS